MGHVWAKITRENASDDTVLLNDSNFATTTAADDQDDYLMHSSEDVMDIGYFSYFLSLYLLDKETQRDTYLNPCSEFILNFLDIIYSQMTPFHKQSFLLRFEPLSFRLCLIQ